MKIYFDMDGVLADWVAGFDKLFKNEVTYSDFNSLPKDEYDDIKNVIANRPAFYYNLPQIESTVEAVVSLIEDGYDVAILTSCGKINTDHVVTQKKRWIKKVFGGYDIPFYSVSKSAHKAFYAEPDAVLIDDRDKALEPFKASGGNVIKFDENTDLISELKPYLLKVM